MSKYLSTSPALRAARVAVFWVMLGVSAAGSSQAAPGPSQGRTKPSLVLGRCAPEMVKGLFPALSQAGADPRHELRVLITRFGGSEARSQEFGVQVGKRLRAVLTDYARVQLNAVQSELLASAVRVELVLCELGDHQHARAIGEASDADVVLWGQASCNGCTSSQIQHVQISIHAEGANSNNAISQSPNAVMTNDVHVVEPKITVTPSPAPRSNAGFFTTSLTLVHWQGLDTGISSLNEFKRLDKVASLSLPPLVSAQPELLLNVTLGIYASRTGRHGLAAEFFKRASKDIPAGVEGVHRLYRMLGMSYFMIGQSYLGLDTLKEALHACPNYDLGCRQAGLNELGLAQLRSGNVSWARDSFETSLSLALERGDILSEATALNNLGLVYREWESPAKALSYYERALLLRQKAGDIAGEAATLNNIGLVYAARGEMVQAMSIYERALFLKQKVGDVAGEAVTLNHLGMVYFILGDKAKALGCFERALPLSQKGKDTASEGATLNNFGLVYSSLGEQNKALRYFERALILTQTAREFASECIAYDNLGLVLRELRRFPEAVRNFQAAAACHSRRYVFDEKKRAQNSLDRAFSSALFGQLTFEAQAVLKELAKEGGIQSALRRARLAGLSSSAEVAAYYALRAVADSDLPEKQVLLVLAHAGQTRATYRASWPNCDGVVIPEVRPASPAVVLGLQAGDVLLRYDGQCLHDPSDLAAVTRRPAAGRSVTLELWRGTGVVRLSASGSSQLVGIRTAAF